MKVYCKVSKYSARIKCKHLNTPLLAEFNLLKIASGFTCYNNMEIVQYIDNTNVTTCCEKGWGTDTQQVLSCRWHFFHDLTD